MELRAEIAAKALIRRAFAHGAFAAITATGDPDAGAIMLKVSLLDGRAIVHSPALDAHGERMWTQPLGLDPVPEATADQYLAKRRDSDPDLWIVEIEDRQGRAFLV